MKETLARYATDYRVIVLSTFEGISIVHGHYLHGKRHVRELANVIERAAVLGDGPEITGEDLPLRIADTDMVGATDGFSYRHAVDAARSEVIKKALAHTRGNRAAAARILGMHKTHLLNLMKSLRIEPNRDSNSYE